MEKLEKILSPMANYLNNNKVIQAISKGIMSTMAALMVGGCRLNPIKLTNRCLSVIYYKLWIKQCF